MRRLLPLAAFALLIGSVGLRAQKQYVPKKEEIGKAPGPQPIPFNHKQHSALGIKCADCHPIKDPGYQAGYPSERSCMGCHMTIKKDSPHIVKLAAFVKEKKPVPWVKVYSVPDYVYFSHASHVEDAKLECSACHGPVAEREVIVLEKSTAMDACMKCHAEMGASNGCDFCHASQ
jgi:hypothetical protein